MEIVEVKGHIENIIAEIGLVKAVIRVRAEAKAQALSEYRKQMAITILKLRNGVITEWEGQEIKNVTSTLSETIARGICWEYKLNEQETEGLYKSAITTLDALKAQLNGYQSIYKHLEN